MFFFNFHFNTENAKWLLNVKWQMEGVDIHLDVNIGKQLSALGHTLTTLSSFEEDECTTIYSQDSDDGDHTDRTNKVIRQQQHLLLHILLREKGKPSYFSFSGESNAASKESSGEHSCIYIRSKFRLEKTFTYDEKRNERTIKNNK